MTQPIPPSVPPASDEIDVLRAIKIVAARWRLVLVMTLAMAAIATVVAFRVHPTFAADVVLLVSADEDNGKLQGLSNIASQFGVGGAVGGDDSTNRRAEAIATLQSEILTERYVEANGLMPILFAAQWDAALKRWKGDDPARYPTLWDANQLFVRRLRTVAEDRRTGVITLTIAWTDGQLAAKWANGLVELTNSYLRQKAIARSERNLAYLTQELRETKTIEIQGAINQLIEGEIKKTMLARGNDEYAFKIIDPAVVPPYRPVRRRELIIFAGTVIGIFAGIALSLFLAWFKRPKRA